VIGNGKLWADLMTRLEPLGLVSAYHRFFNEGFGAETRPTHFFKGKQGSPFHLDYFFVPAAWMSRVASVEVGTYEAWSSYSDHAPVTVDMRPEGQAPLENVERWHLRRHDERHRRSVPRRRRSLEQLVRAIVRDALREHLGPEAGDLDLARERQAGQPASTLIRRPWRPVSLRERCEPRGSA
jgi:hypothetical protein